jgi:hypothetical protein
VYDRELVITNVFDCEIQDTERIGAYDLVSIEVDARRGVIEVKAEPDLRIVLKVGSGFRIIFDFVRTAENRSPLHTAAASGQHKRVKLLIIQGAEVDCKDLNGITPLHEAAKSGHVAVVRLLLKAGAKIGARNADGKTPLDMALENGHKEIGDLLRKRGGKTGKELEKESK